jgi:uncharacterized protein YcbX
VPTVSSLSVAPVKGLALVHPREVQLEVTGVAENRRFYLIDADGRRYGLLRDGSLALVVPEYDAEAGRLSLRFPDGGEAAGEVALDGAVTTDFYGRDVAGRVVVGPWAEALSEYVGRPLRLIQADRPGVGVDRDRGPVSMVSEASLDELRRRAGREEPVDGRRFRMLIGLAGCRPHEEDEWLGRRVLVGDAVVLLHEQVARCAITTQNPATGRRDFDTLHAIKGYRGLRHGAAIDFGVYGEVAEPGAVRMGDSVRLL